MNPDRVYWNRQQQALRRSLSNSNPIQPAIELFLCQHASVHAGEIAQAGGWSFDDEAWQGLSVAGIRCIPPGGEHSLAWIFWHMARIEGVTMNLLVAGSPQVLCQDHWLERMATHNRDSGNAMTIEQLAELSAALDIPALQAYRAAVGRRTREIVRQLSVEDIKRKVDPARLRQVVAEGAVVAAAQGVIDYWGGLNIAGLLLMAPTRHNFLHLNEALRIRQKLHL